MIHQELLRRAVPESDKVLIDFVDYIAPKILEYFAAVPALGGSGQLPAVPGLEIPAGLQTYTEKDYANFSKLADQSMATHLLNGIFAAMRLAEKLPPNKTLTEDEKRLWILGYVCHDYTKIYGVKVAAADIPVIRELLEQLGVLLNFEPFMPRWKGYLGDVAFLAQNTQTKEGSNLDISLFKVRADKVALDNMRFLSSIADVLVHVKSPSEVVISPPERQTAENIREKMISLFGAQRAPRLTYHKLTEVRGLLSNIVNNAVMQAFEKQGCEPFLFFPNGIVYLLPPDKKDISPFPDLQNRAWEIVRDLLLYGQRKTADDDIELDFESDESDDGDDDVGGGLGIRSRRGLKVPAILYEILSLPQLLGEGKNAALNVKGTVALERYLSQKDQTKSDYLQTFKGKQRDEVKSYLTQEYEKQYQIALDNRTDQVAEFLAFIWRRVLNEVFADIEKSITKGSEVPKTTQNKLPKGYYTAKLILEWLDFSDVTPEEAAFQKGMRIPTGWYCVAAGYLQQHLTFDTDAISRLFDSLIAKLLNFVQEKGLKPKAVSVFEPAFLEYVASILEIEGKQTPSSLFARESSNYIQRKDSNKLNCSLCSSPFEASEQRENAVLFKGQQYSNKGKLGVSQVKRGSCPICTVEMLLRIVQQSAPSTAFQDQKPIYFWLYPTYFFTTETAQVVRSYLEQLKDLNFFDLRKHLQTKGFTASALLEYPGFVAQKDDDHAWGIVRQEYDQHDVSALFSFAIKPFGKDTSDTDSWVIPAFYALALPLLLDVKVVVTTSFVPLFGSGADFQETTILDAPHQFTRYALGKDRFRVNELPAAVIRLLRLYDLHLDVFAETTKLHWPQINALAKDIVTDPNYIFFYYDHKKRKESNQGDFTSSATIERYLATYYTLGGQKNMGLIGELVDAYAVFYRPKWGKMDSAYAVLKPLSEAADVVIGSDPKTDKETLLEFVSGAVGDLMQRVWANNADGWDPIVMRSSEVPRDERMATSREKQAEFTRFFVEDVFYKYCNGDRGSLREKLNVMRSAARFYYQSKYAKQSKEEDND